MESLCRLYKFRVWNRPIFLCCDRVWPQKKGCGLTVVSPQKQAIMRVFRHSITLCDRETTIYRIFIEKTLITYSSFYRKRAFYCKSVVTVVSPSENLAIMRYLGLLAVTTLVDTPDRRTALAHGMQKSPAFRWKRGECPKNPENYEKNACNLRCKRVE